MKYKCDKCDRPATHHSVEMVKGKPNEMHLCEQHAADAGLSVSASHAPINELLTHYIKMTDNKGGPKGKPGGVARVDRKCPDCGLKFSDFREKSLLGCPGCYTAFKRPLITLLERAHEGGSQHVGKVPRRSGGGEQRQLLIARMRKRLDNAIAAENYELAAQLRDDISGMERPDAPAKPSAAKPRTAVTDPSPAPGGVTDTPGSTDKEDRA
ncbi:UvrB/UvrC motif-containing protein [Phycisphaeraceae bacterium D3-23]